jgi:predicted amidophosphoribosyltransferase
MGHAPRQKWDKSCCYCDRKALYMRRYCRDCLERLRWNGVVDLPSYPTQEDSRRAQAPNVLDFLLVIPLR